ncbi:MAG: M23 family metallopeptidase [Clostridia bacterium]|nr:M23 family metallopeptidase [Clostridia bacterium]
MNMNTNQQKQDKLNKGIAIAVAVLLALTLIVTIIAFTASKRSAGAGTTAPVKLPSKTTGTISTPNGTGNTPTTPGTDGTSAPGTQTPDGGDEPTGAEEPDFVCPVNGTLVKDYSADIPVFSLTMEDYRVHCGLDIAADAGTDVLAAANGEITKVFYDPMMGQTVEITHDGGYVTVYKNLQTKLPEGTAEGAKVTAGDVIGYVGDTALVEISEGPHVHFEMYKDEEIMNPLSKVSLPEKDAGSDYED